MPTLPTTPPAIALVDVVDDGEPVLVVIAAVAAPVPEVDTFPVLTDEDGVVWLVVPGYVVVLSVNTELPKFADWALASS
jgi:hypothetical protein